jgi:hypothetical protein
MCFLSEDKDPFFKNREVTEMLKRKNRDSVRKYRNKKIDFVQFKVILTSLF